MCLYKEVFVIFFMEQENCVLPVQCKRCDAVFDLWYDMEELERFSGTEFGARGAMYRLLSESLCPGCRRKVVSSMRRRQKVSECDDLVLSL